MLKNYTVLLIACCFGLQAQIPITITNANMPSANDTLRYTNVSLTQAGSYQQGGSNLTWDFSTVESLDEGLRMFRPALLTPYKLFFAGPQYYGEKVADQLGAGPVAMNDYYLFYRKRTSPAAFVAEGAGLTFSNIPLPAFYTDEDELYNFPLSYLRYDSTTFRFSTPPMGVLPVQYSRTGYRTSMVDGWGTVITPYGSETCLRLVTTQYSMDSIKNTLVPFPLGFPVVTRSYQWLSLTAKMPWYEVSGTIVAGQFQPSMARYRGYTKNPVSVEKSDHLPGITVYPNPVQSHLYVAGAGDCQIHLLDLSGRELRILAVNDGKIDLSDLQPGAYLLRMQANDRVASLPIIKE